jgi:KDO2-lipid IV(A) lauroyltransferase
MTFFFWCTSQLPLRWLHAIGALLGVLIYKLPGRYSDRLRANYKQAFPDAGLGHFLEAARATGRMMMEIPYFWMRKHPLESLELLPADRLEPARQALAQGKGLIVVSAHLGAFEMLGPMYATLGPMTLLFKPPRRRFLQGWVERMRAHPGLATAPANARGLRMLVKALKRGETIGILSDQCPSMGQGEWAPFFGRDAYTMTLVQRLQALNGTPILLSFAERLASGGNYRLHSHVLPQLLPAEPEMAVEKINSCLESMIRKAPSQYLWSYNRYKAP